MQRGWVYAIQFEKPEIEIPIRRKPAGSEYVVS